jgi:bifunctional DNA-binding transcriptional regulator/antitoxin component of YhaV-PrlF toxin-antitoxin module
MAQSAPDEPRISAVKLSSQGQVTLSKEARQQHGLTAGETLIEVSLPGCIILLPQSEVLAEIMLKAQTGLQKLGLGVDELKAKVRERSKSRLKERYPGVFDD